MFAGLFKGWARRRHAHEAQELIDHVADLSDENVGYVLAIAAHHRNRLIESGVALGDLAELIRTQPSYVIELERAMGALARADRHQDVLGLKVWVCSLRAVLDPALYETGAALWRELSRGRKYIAQAREAVRAETDFDLDVAGADTPAVFKEN